jgi:hypothetical protein
MVEGFIAHHTTPVATPAQEFSHGRIDTAMALPSALGRRTLAVVTHENTIHFLAYIACAHFVR